MVVVDADSEARVTTRSRIDHHRAGHHRADHHVRRARRRRPRARPPPQLAPLGVEDPACVVQVASGDSLGSIAAARAERSSRSLDPGRERSRRRGDRSRPAPQRMHRQRPRRHHRRTAARTQRCRRGSRDLRLGHSAAGEAQRAVGPVRLSRDAGPRRLGSGHSPSPLRERGSRRSAGEPLGHGAGAARGTAAPGHDGPADPAERRHGRSMDPRRPDLSDARHRRGPRPLVDVFPTSTGEQGYETRPRSVDSCSRFDPAPENGGWHDRAYPVAEDNPLNGNMYKPLYFDEGQAIHGANMPTGPRSKGCARLKPADQDRLIAWLGLGDVSGTVGSRPHRRNRDGTRKLRPRLTDQQPGAVRRRLRRSGSPGGIREVRDVGLGFWPPRRTPRRARPSSRRTGAPCAT